jgi:hypothetical protein
MGYPVFLFAPAALGTDFADRDYFLDGLWTQGDALLQAGFLFLVVQPPLILNLDGKWVRWITTAIGT